MFNRIFFEIFPYLAVTVLVVVGIYRYFSDRFSFSSLSSQFLESRQLFWGSVPWHYGIIIILLGHLIGFLIPRQVMAFNGVPLRLYILEVSALAFGILTLFGLVGLVVRRTTNTRVQKVTSRMDVVLLVMLLLQVVTGLYIALFDRWGSGWYVTTAVPWLWSLVKLSPETQLMASLPLMVKLHAINAFALLAVFPFTRLVHITTVPFTYIWRPYQVVIWMRRNGARGTNR